MYLYAVVLLMSHTLANSETFIIPLSQAERWRKGIPQRDLPAFCREVFALFDIRVGIGLNLEEKPIRMTRHSAKKPVPGFIHI